MMVVWWREDDGGLVGWGEVHTCCKSLVSTGWILLLMIVGMFRCTTVLSVRALVIAGRMLRLSHAESIKMGSTVATGSRPGCVGLRDQWRGSRIVSNARQTGRQWRSGAGAGLLGSRLFVHLIVPAASYRVPEGPGRKSLTGVKIKIQLS